MRTLTDAELLNVWERGLGQPAVYQALNLLAASASETPPQDWAAVSIGRRDAAILALRERTFGSRIASLATCPACSELAEVTFEVAQVLAEVPSESLATLSLVDFGYRVEFRLPNSLDVAAIENEASVEAARNTLFARCMLSAERDGESVSVSQLPLELVGKVADRMSIADPQADIRLDCICPACDHAWQAAFDIVTFFGTEIHTWAARMLREIHLFASAYGWREADVLALSPTRRRLYLELIDA